jgi:hypothetical protein
MRGMTIRSRPATLLGALLLLAGCAGERVNGLFSNSPQEPAYTGSIRPQADMTGRWMLVSPGRGQCSRNWNFEQAGLILRDHTGAPLGQLSAAGNARFDGRSVAGEPITLYR